MKVEKNNTEKIKQCINYFVDIRDGKKWTDYYSIGLRRSIRNTIIGSHILRNLDVEKALAGTRVLVVEKTKREREVPERTEELASRCHRRRLDVNTTIEERTPIIKVDQFDQLDQAEQENLSTEIDQVNELTAKQKPFLNFVRYAK